MTSARTTIAPSRLLRLVTCLAAAGLLAAALAASAGAAKRPLITGFWEDNFLTTDDATREAWFGEAAKAGVRLVRINVRWRGVSPDAAPVPVETDPASPGYDWEEVDAAVRSAAARRMPVMFTVYTAPEWAEGAGEPANVNGPWKPDPAAYGRFGQALATRYSGSYPDPDRPGSTLPRVRYYEAWNEPNLDEYLAPQWQGKKSVGPGMYRTLLNSFYDGVKSAQRGAQVIAPATAPYGDLPGGTRTPPVQFLRRLLCLRGGKLRPVRCPVKARFDILSHHPINSVAGPRRSARSPLDASTPDIGRLRRVVRRAERLRRVLPAGKRRQVWGTELWWETDPPDTVLGIPPARQARYTRLAAFVLWQQGVRVALFYTMVDQPPTANPLDSLDSGIYFSDGRRKPSFRAFRFPLATQRLRGGRKLIWGEAPQRGRVRVQRRTRSGWRTFARARGRPNVPFTVRRRLRGGTAVRAISRGVASPVVRVR